MINDPVPAKELNYYLLKSLFSDKFNVNLQWDDCGHYPGTFYEGVCLGEADSDGWIIDITYCVEFKSDGIIFTDYPTFRKERDAYAENYKDYINMKMKDIKEVIEYINDKEAV